MSLLDALEKSLKVAKTEDRDEAAVALARHYAQLLDMAPSVEVAKDLGPKYLQVLEALGLAKSRHAKGGQPSGIPSAGGPAAIFAGLVASYGPDARANQAANLDSAAD